MRQTDFKKMLEKQVGYKIFSVKVHNYLESTNNKRKAKERWSNFKLENKATEMWESLVEKMYAQLDSSIDCNKYNREEKWNEFIEQNEIIVDFNESISDMEFE
ncbi:hypothetical protein [Enterococcus sp. AZ103]|uniref:hypothetical protein n=1 Tax=Enterococcus sp. AZ103 TaxID=2774628 RepID=UPI003F2710FE